VKSLEELNHLLQQLEDNVVGYTCMTEDTTRGHLHKRLVYCLRDIRVMCDLVIEVRAEVAALEKKVE
jgi:hypothetical protein